RNLVQLPGAANPGAAAPLGSAARCCQGQILPRNYPIRLDTADLVT
ncbi:unnamed protein product, partial [Penicillium egyptiacum]